MKIHLLLFVFALSISSIFAQQEVRIERLNLLNTLNLNKPIMVDSTNLDGKKFQNKDLLNTFVSSSKQPAQKEILKADILNYFQLQKPTKDARMYQLSFDFSADKKTKTKIKVLGTSMYKVLVNGKEELSKTTIEDSLSQAKFMTVNHTTGIGTYNVEIRYVSFADNKSPESIKVMLESDSKDSTIVYSVDGEYKKRNITIDDIWVGKRTTNTSISPNGQYLTVNYTTTKDDGKTFSEKELVNLKTNRRMPLSFFTSYYWLPVTNKLYYKETVDKKVLLKTLNPDTQEVEVLASDIPSGTFYFTPDEKTLIYIDKEEDKAKKKSLIRIESPEARQGGYYDRSFLSRYNLSEGFKQQLTFGKHSTAVNDISADSRYLLYSTREEIIERPFRQQSMFCLDMQTMSIDTIWLNEKFAYSAKFSPDGKKLLMLGAAESFEGIGLNIKPDQTSNSYHLSAYIMDRSTKQVEPITKDFAPSIALSHWNVSDGMIYFRVTDKDCESVYRYNYHSKQFTKLPLKEDVVKTFSFADKAAFASYTGVSQSNSTRAYSLDLKSDKSVLVADPSKDRLDKIQLSKVEDWKFTSSDGTEIDGRYYLPPNFDASQKYPLIVYYYGGTMPTPRALEGPYSPHVYAALGYVVYVLQPSGAVGYGQEFAARHVNAWGKRTAEDIMEGTKQFMEEHSYVNDKKVGCIGASYGGFMTMYLQTQTNMFAAAVSHAGISSLSSYWGEGYWGYSYSGGASANSYPWNNKELYVEQSPLFNADNINTPLLLLHGTADTNVPIGESIQMYTALKILGKPVELVQVVGENHGIRDFKKRIEWNNTIYAWFAKWLQDDSTDWDKMYPVK